MMNYFDDLGIQVDDIKSRQFEIFYKLLIEENEKYNLTAITERKDVYIKHFLDSILVEKLDFEFNGKKVIDIGTGAGFPAIPLKIMNPQMRITGLDALNKRIGFIKMVQKELSLKDIELIHGRAEDFGQMTKYREQYDFAVSRAVAELRLLLELVMPFVNVGGYFIAYKSLKTKTELEDATHALNEMKSKLIDIVEFKLPEDFGTRDMMIIQKMGKINNKYPRKPGIPKKSPL
ncbi:16S rRNA (guanine(527)-N(7))-methyltransferase RsmG [Fusibacter bizertensis]|uniref:Ribosomal RNA small subunit methyltransferase G n=1 Tax=Fusibacter bizertensis TaxID=1488331 RepID=A0ABT6NFK5_9FIRM|nr:16S rRNA (guanine(527)-N(7))-methyltransferase RsmG [Fusibacter bizertensis]MDH8679181.1 16S rRNA (guanine(527)-N(7))-methyltransferase RsmG [Fusibacter bizertensis]